MKQCDSNKKVVVKIETQHTVKRTIKIYGDANFPLVNDYLYLVFVMFQKCNFIGKKKKAKRIK